MAESSILLRCYSRKRIQGSNPCLSALIIYANLTLVEIINIEGMRKSDFATGRGDGVEQSASRRICVTESLPLRRQRFLSRDRGIL